MRKPVSRVEMGKRLTLSKLLGCVTIILLIQSCTNSKLLISPLYNRLDDRMRSAFNELGDFNDEQKTAFEQSVGTFHVWHRQSELPLYADLMQQVATSIAQADTDETHVQQWMDEAEIYTRRARECHPINFSFDLMKSLTDEQFDFIEAHFREEQQENRERYNSRTPEERVQRRIRNTIKWAGRINLQITPTQRAMLLTAFKKQISLRKEYYELSGEWNRQFFTLAKQQNNPNYNEDISTHLDRLWGLLENGHPEQWQANRDLWKATALRFVKSMTNEQRVLVSRWLKKMAATLKSISRDKPSFKVVNDPGLGCLVNPDEA